MKESRRKQIETLVAERQSVTMQELCDTFGVSMNTIRSDVASLVSSGAVEKIYGGIRVKERKQVPLFTSRTMRYPEHKLAIAQAAAQLIEDRDILYIDAGTTTMHILDYLDPNKQVTIVTSSLPVIIKAYENPNINLVVLPGMYNRRTNILIDDSTPKHLSRYQHTKAFLGVSSLSDNGSLGVSSYLEHDLKHTAMTRSQHSILLTDSSKLGETNLLSYGTIQDMSLIITDSNMPEHFLALCRESSVPVKQV